MKIHLFRSGAVLLLVLLARSAPAQHPVYEFPGSPGDSLGEAVGAAGDVDGDGFPDVIVGLPRSDPNGNNSGTVHVYSGRTGAKIRTFLGTQAGAFFGAAVAGLGDIDGDGLSDLIVGAPYYDSSFNFNTGRVYLLSSTGTILATHTGTTNDGNLGYSVCGPGDVDGDGVPDYAFGAPNADTFGGVDSGNARVHSGADFQFIYSINGASGDRTGHSVAGAGDVNGDGLPDVAVGSPGRDTNGLTSNGAAVVYNKTGGAVLVLLGAWNNGWLGASVSGADVNGDGFSDLIAGELWADGGGTDAGRVVVKGGKSPFPILFDIAGVPGSEFGKAVAGIGDVDGDGKAEFAAGAHKMAVLGVGNVVGKAFLFAGASGTELYSWTGKIAGDGFAETLARAGDLNQDGKADLIVGAPFSPLYGFSAGYARVFLTQAPSPSTYCTAKTNSLGCKPAIASSGTPSLAIANDFHVKASSVLGNVFGLWMWSHAPASTPFAGGTLCLAAPVKRTPVQSSGGLSGSCSGDFDFHVSQAYMASQAMAAGQTVFSQYWSRDPGFAPPNNVSLSNALSFEVFP